MEDGKNTSAGVETPQLLGEYDRYVTGELPGLSSEEITWLARDKATGDCQLAQLAGEPLD